MASTASKKTFLNRLKTAAARRCRVYDVGGEYTYQHLAGHIPPPGSQTNIVVCVSTKGAAEDDYGEVRNQILLWIDVINAISPPGITPPDITFVGTMGLGTLAEMLAFDDKVKSALVLHSNLKFKTTMLVMLSDHTCFMQHYHELSCANDVRRRAIDEIGQLPDRLHSIFRSCFNAITTPHLEATVLRCLLQPMLAKIRTSTGAPGAPCRIEGIEPDPKCDLDAAVLTVVRVLASYAAESPPHTTTAAKDANGQLLQLRRRFQDLVLQHGPRLLSKALSSSDAPFASDNSLNLCNLQLDRNAVDECESIYNSLTTAFPSSLRADLTCLAEVTRCLLNLAVGIIPHKLVCKLGDLCGPSNQFSDGGYLSGLPTSVETGSSAELLDLKYRILECVLHEHERGRVVDRPEIAVAMLLAGVAHQSASTAECQAYFDRAMEIASRLLDRNDAQLMSYRQLTRSMQRCLDPTLNKSDLTRERELRTKLIADLTQRDGLEALIILTARHLREGRPYEDRNLWIELQCNSDRVGAMDDLLREIVLLSGTVETSTAHQVHRITVTATGSIQVAFVRLLRNMAKVVPDDDIERGDSEATDKRLVADCQRPWFIRLMTLVVKLHSASRQDARCDALDLVKEMMDAYTCPGLLVGVDGRISSAVLTRYLSFRTGCSPRPITADDVLWAMRGLGEKGFGLRFVDEGADHLTKALEVKWRIACPFVKRTSNLTSDNATFRHSLVTVNCSLSSMYAFLLKVDAAVDRNEFSPTDSWNTGALYMSTTKRDVVGLDFAPQTFRGAVPHRCEILIFGNSKTELARFAELADKVRAVVFPSPIENAGPNLNDESRQIPSHLREEVRYEVRDSFDQALKQRKLTDLHTHLTGMGSAEFWVDMMMRRAVPSRTHVFVPASARSIL